MARLRFPPTRWRSIVWSTRSAFHGFTAGIAVRNCWKETFIAIGWKRSLAIQRTRDGFARHAAITTTFVAIIARKTSVSSANGPLATTRRTAMTTRNAPNRISCGRSRRASSALRYGLVDQSVEREKLGAQRTAPNQVVDGDGELSRAVERCETEHGDDRIRDEEHGHSTQRRERRHDGDP